MGKKKKEAEEEEKTPQRTNWVTGWVVKMFSIHFYHLMNIFRYINMEKAFNEFAIDWDNQLGKEREVCVCLYVCA